MEFHQKQIWLINFDPAFGHEFQKVRPGLIIENDLYIPQFDLLTIIPISSKIDNLYILDILVPKTNLNRLLKESVIKEISSVEIAKNSGLINLGILSIAIIGNNIFIGTLDSGIFWSTEVMLPPHQSFYRYN